MENGSSNTPIIRTGQSVACGTGTGRRRSSYMGRREDLRPTGTIA